ncbi:alanine racemase [Salinibacterium sp. G-O1]|uniref:alanine racemase n=1 Tax=Salinibacterium sp. G-O1 TaxID=3046208 RepID=UPI0024BAE889|nr:alanine racemase [Salinibacterium sp. G-O1]MDJ0336208.1 alanine racemase [Salinibacterium sp. G-O1]
MDETVLGSWAKSFPPTSWGVSADRFVATQPHLSDFATPLLTIDSRATAHNVEVMAAWLTERGLQIAPHGKTTMAPKLWQQLLDGGAWGITLATAWQVQLARSFGFSRIILANELIDPVALAWLGAELADPDFGFLCWVDSVEAVELMRRGLSSAARPVDVAVELGSTGGRTGARSVEQALAVAAAVEAAPELRLAGVAGYEGSYGNDRTDGSVGAVQHFLDRLVAVHDAIQWDVRPIVTAGGSAFFDLVADTFAPLVDRATVILRSGAFQVHDDGFYDAVTPMPQLKAAMHGWARVISRPEASLAILDGGKRDFPYDLGLPAARFGRVERINDQHSYLRLTGEAPAVGDVLRLGLSHPCTAFDKWRAIPMIEDASAEDPLVTDVVLTYF